MANVTRVKRVDIKKLVPYEHNAKIHSEEQIKKLAESIKQFGFISPVLIDEDLNIIAGHGRVKAAVEAGLLEVPCVTVEGLSEAERRAYILADNRLSEFGKWDLDMVQFEIGNLEALDLNFDISSLDFPEPKIESVDLRDPSCQHNAFENQDREQFPCNSYYGMPEMEPTQTIGDKMLRFMDWKEVEDLSEYIAHFYYDDYKFISAWREPDKYIDRLKQFKAVVSPDFSLYTDFPRALQILSCYRRQWCGAYWQSLGIDVIPDVVWGDKESYSYCFDGIPSGGTVAVSTVGVTNNKEWNGKEGDLFRDGYNEMLNRLKPKTILFYGDKIEGLDGNIIVIPSYYAQKREMLNERSRLKNGPWVE